MQLAQLNIAKAKYPLDAPEIADFVENLDPINALAEASAGFIWRLQDDSGNATSISAMADPDMLVNMSVWQDIDSLKEFMYRTHHKEFLRRKKEWFHRLTEDSYVLWWVPAGHTPTVAEAMERLLYLRQHGDTPYAFTFRNGFQPAEVFKAVKT